MQKGNIGVTTQNIFPVIKKFLYSDHEIFLRELVSNAVDATQKLKTLSSFGDFKGELGTLDVTVTVDKEAGTLTVSDRGIGMTAEEVDRYINQIAFSGAEDFLERYKDRAASIIGHFGLGFYSAFMVADKVEIHTLSCKEGAKAVCWQCDGSPEYEMSDCDKTDRGTDIVLHIDDDNKEFLEQSRIDTLLKKYCRFLPVPVMSGGRVINDTEPRWTKKPSELTDDDYRAFYHELYPGQDDPLFWIHLNVDYPFTLTGILFFPKLHSNLEIRKDRIQLYCNQVFVTDSVEGVVPEFMMLMQGVIDSPDIPLNVSRSYLQSDSAVKKISAYITKKVASRLEDMFKADRRDYEAKWDDIRIFIEYGMLTDPKFCDQVMGIVLLKDTEGNYYTIDEYRKLIEGSQTDRSGDLICLYATDTTAQYTYINAAQSRGYNVLVMDGQLDSHFIGLLEQKMDKTRFVRVDSDVVDRLIARDDHAGDTGLTAMQRSMLSTVFSSQIPQVDKANFVVEFSDMPQNGMPVLVTQNEFMRRMKDMAAMQPGMNFYADLPDSYTLVVNTANAAVKNIVRDATAAIGSEVEPLFEAAQRSDSEIATLRGDGKTEPDAEAKQKISDLEKAIGDSRNQQEEIARNYAATNDTVRQAIDLALLSAGLLRGSNLAAFVERSAKSLN